MELALGREGWITHQRESWVGERVDAIISRRHWRLHHGYPTLSVERDAILREVLPALEARDIYSRGRDGAWKYEVSNQDHSLMQGVEIAERLVIGREQLSLLRPDLANRRFNA